MDSLEAVLLQLNASNTYYTSGEHATISIKIGSNKPLLLDYTYHIHMNIFQNYTIHEDTANNYDL